MTLIFRQNFTSYERDFETHLDLAQARMYASKLGRFSRPDSFLNDSYATDAQSWNLYIYVRNNPLLYVDRFGKDLQITINKKIFRAIICDEKVKLVKKNEDYVFEPEEGSDEELVINALNSVNPKIVKQLINSDLQAPPNAIDFYGNVDPNTESEAFYENVPIGIFNDKNEFIEVVGSTQRTVFFGANAEQTAAVLNTTLKEMNDALGSVVDKSNEKGYDIKKRTLAKGGGVPVNKKPSYECEEKPPEPPKKKSGIYPNIRKYRLESLGIESGGFSSGSRTVLR